MCSWYQFLHSIVFRYDLFMSASTLQYQNPSSHRSGYDINYRGWRVLRFNDITSAVLGSSVAMMTHQQYTDEESNEEKELNLDFVSVYPLSWVKQIVFIYLSWTRTPPGSARAPPPRAAVGTWTGSPYPPSCWVSWTSGRVRLGWTPEWCSPGAGGEHVKMVWV